MNKPDYISSPDWELLNKKYSKKKIKKYLDNNYPYQYLIGDVMFYNSIIKVNKNVLIPRWETEELVNRVVNKLDKCNYNPKRGLDICTGSGCIAIALSKHYDIYFDAIDISRKALKVAATNIKNNKVKVKLVRNNVLKDSLKGKYDIIISNPPYVSIKEEIDEATKYQPKKALYANNNGLEFYEVLLSNIRNVIDEKYLIAMEYGSTQKSAIKKIANKYFPKNNIILEKDLNNRDRYLFITNIE